MAKQAVSRSIARISLIAGVALMAVAGTAQAAAGDIVLRARALYLDPANEGTDTAAAISLSSKYIWEIDASYFVTNNVALELIATTPQKHTVYLNGSPVGTLRHLPPTLTAQYHFAPTNPTIRPYVGLGVNYTHLSAVNVSVGGNKVTLDNKSWGLAYNVGADFPINDKLSVNVDFKKIDLQTEATLAGTGKIGTVKVNPVLFGVGIGYKF
jgi:outer membrane protein